MTTAEIAKGLVDLCRQGKNMEAIEKYYSPDIVSVESAAPPGGNATSKGMEGVRNKNKWWLDNHEIHSAQVNGPYIGDEAFAVEFAYDVTQKPTGKRFHMNEMALYIVKGDKIVHEHFFYNMGGEPQA